MLPGCAVRLRRRRRRQRQQQNLSDMALVSYYNHNTSTSAHQFIRPAGLLSFPRLLVQPGRFHFRLDDQDILRFSTGRQLFILLVSRINPFGGPAGGGGGWMFSIQKSAGRAVVTQLMERDGPPIATSFRFLIKSNFAQWKRV